MRIEEDTRTSLGLELCEPAKCMLGYMIRFRRLIVQVKDDMLDPPVLHICNLFHFARVTVCTCVLPRCLPRKCFYCF